MTRSVLKKCLQTPYNPAIMADAAEEGKTASYPQGAAAGKACLCSEGTQISRRIRWSGSRR